MELHTLAAGDDYRAEVGRALAHNHAYCARHGYRYHVHRRAPSTRPPAWYKIPIMHRALKRGAWAAWIDADCLIVDQEKPLTEFVDPAYDLTFAPGQMAINAGVWIASPRPWTREFLRLVWHDPLWAAPGRILWEQQRILQLYEADALNCRRHIRLVDREDWYDGRFILHLSGRHRFPQIWGAGALHTAIDEALARS